MMVTQRRQHPQNLKSASSERFELAAVPCPRGSWFSVPGGFSLKKHRHNKSGFVLLQREKKRNKETLRALWRKNGALFCHLYSRDDTIMLLLTLREKQTQLEPHNTRSCCLEPDQLQNRIWIILPLRCRFHPPKPLSYFLSTTSFSTRCRPTVCGKKKKRLKKYVFFVANFLFTTEVLFC